MKKNDIYFQAIGGHGYHLLIGHKYREYEGIWSLGKHKVETNENLDKEQYQKMLEEKFAIRGIDMDALIIELK